MACSPQPENLARNADAKYRTGAFTWMLTHEPAALVTWGVDGGDVRRLLPHARIATAGKRPCADAKAAHASLLVIAGAAAVARRERAQDCGLALFKDAGALVVAPL